MPIGELFNPNLASASSFTTENYIYLGSGIATSNFRNAGLNQEERYRHIVEKIIRIDRKSKHIKEIGDWPDKFKAIPSYMPDLEDNGNGLQIAPAPNGELVVAHRYQLIRSAANEEGWEFLYSGASEDKIVQNIVATKNNVYAVLGHRAFYEPDLHIQSNSSIKIIETDGKLTEIGTEHPDATGNVVSRPIHEELWLYNIEKEKIGVFDLASKEVTQNLLIPIAGTRCMGFDPTGNDLYFLHNQGVTKFSV